MVHFPLRERARRWIGGRYARVIKIVRDHWRILHVSVTAIFYITLGIHILVKTGIL